MKYNPWSIVNVHKKILIVFVTSLSLPLSQNHFTSIRWKSIWHKPASVNWTQYCVVKLIGQLFTVLALTFERAKYSRHRFQTKDQIYHCDKREISQAAKRYVQFKYTFCLTTTISLNINDKHSVAFAVGESSKNCSFSLSLASCYFSVN